ncbi:MAG: GMC family oxidoreductase [Pseudomonadota bacterium]
MFAPIDPETAAARTWDAILVGSSFASMFFLLGLPAGANVLIVEKGLLAPHVDQLNGARPKPETFRQRDPGPDPKPWVAHSMVGGNSNCWWGQVPRFQVSDFTLFEDHGRAAPWPLRYGDIEGAYATVETVMEAAGDSETPGRQRPYPFPPHTMGRAEARAAEVFPQLWRAAPTARSNGGARPKCCANGVCSLCPVDAKFTILNAVEKFNRPEVRMLTGVGAETVTYDGARASGVALHGGLKLRSGLVALGAGAIWNATILLRSGLGLPALGRYLHEQASIVRRYDVGHPGLFGGSSITAHYLGELDGPFRKVSASVLVESFTTGVPVRSEPGRWSDRMQVKFIAEDLPQPENRVTLGPDGSPRITWNGHHPYALAGLSRAEARFSEALPFPIERLAAGWTSATEAHIQGTHRMGIDPETSVVGPELEVHGVRGLFALGSGAFPTCSAANPTLTLSALSLRAGRLAMGASR